MPETAPPIRHVAALTGPYRAPALLLTPTPGADSRSFFCGEPTVSSPSGVPLRLLASIHLPDVQARLPVDWLPKTGDLLFFFDDVNQPWGGERGDLGGWSVLYVADAKLWNSDPQRVPIEFQHYQSVPSLDRLQRLEPDIDLTEAEAEDFEELRERDRQHHQWRGFPLDIQGDDMEAQCQQMYPKTQREDWKLLLQVDSDDVLNFQWGDSGMVYFWIREQDARGGDFSKVWAVLQCY